MTTIYTPEDVYYFAEDGNVDELIIALNQGDNSTNWYRGEDGDTALRMAAYNGHMNCVEMLLNRGIDINSKNNKGYTSLHWAAQKGHINIVEILLNRGIDINSEDIDSYAPVENEDVDEDGNIIEHTDCRPMIFAEVEHR